MQRIYLDHAASVPLEREVRAVLEALDDRACGNPSSLHWHGREARRLVEDARQEVAEFLGVETSEVIFTSGATEANNLALAPPASEEDDSPSRLALSTIEHASVLECAEAQGRPATFIPVDGAGRIRMRSLEETLEGGVEQVAIIGASNEIGTIQDLERASQLCRQAGVRLHVDGVQLVSRQPVDLGRLPGVCTASLSGHKLGGPKGSGALFVRRGVRLAPLILGGGQERGLRAGTENVPGIVGLGAACRLARSMMPERIQVLRRLERVFLEALATALPEARLHGAPRAESLPGLLSIRFPGIKNERFLLALDLEGVSVSTGSACASGASRPSRVLEALGIPLVENLETLRISLGWNQREDEILLAVERMKTVARRLAGS